MTNKEAFKELDDLATKLMSVCDYIMVGQDKMLEKNKSDKIWKYIHAIDTAKISLECMEVISL